MSDKRKETLERLEKEIQKREDEMNRKGNLEDNLTTASGYFTAAGALNWVREVLIKAELQEVKRQ